ncbi:MAG: DUF5665 domain-containing protein [Patescibacteria group bacterium]|nr:DUF5665 domain-containing protein [Patescibacteria group bacterium]
MDQDLKNQLDAINRNLADINKKTSKNGMWRAFFYGVLSGLGSVAGAAIALSIIIYILNAMGIIPAFRNQFNQIERLLEQFQNIR